jgi:hypothetical protein
MDDNKVRLKEKLNLETAKMAWRDLQTFFASGAVIYVSPKQDLLVVAEQLAADNAALFSQWLEEGTVATVSDAQALQWFETDAVLWSVVIKPYILVQETSES